MITINVERIRAFRERLKAMELSLLMRLMITLVQGTINNTGNGATRDEGRGLA
jgi:hypothetical protein